MTTDNPIDPQATAEQADKILVRAYDSATDPAPTLTVVHSVAPDRVVKFSYGVGPIADPATTEQQPATGEPSIDLQLPEELAGTLSVRPYDPANDPKPMASVQVETGADVVHNYGHSGSGFSFSYGCAEEAVDLVQSMEDNVFQPKNDSS